MVLCKLPVPGRPTYLDSSRALAVGSGGGRLDILLSAIIRPLWGRRPYMDLNTFSEGL